MEILERYSLLDSVLPTTTGIYRIYNLISDKQYIGSARAQGNTPCEQGFRARFGRGNGHRLLLKRNNHTSKHLQNAFNECLELGINPNDVFEIQILEYIEPGRCIEIEDLYLKTYKPEYNSHFNAAGGCGYEWTAERRLMQSERMKGKPSPMEGMERSAEYRQKMSNSTKGYKQTPEHILNKSLAKAKSYIGMGPRGEILAFKNAEEFCRNNPRYGFHPTKIGACARGERNTHKGWKFSFDTLDLAV
jgi:group I intron endonuclease